MYYKSNVSLLFACIFCFYSNFHLHVVCSECFPTLSVLFQLVITEVAIIFLLKRLDSVFVYIVKIKSFHMQVISFSDTSLYIASWHSLKSHHLADIFKPLISLLSFNIMFITSSVLGLFNHPSHHSQLIHVSFSNI